MIGILKKEFPIERSAFLQFYDNNKYVEAAEVVHKLKHKINLLNLNEGYTLASDFERQLFDNSPKLFDDFIKLLNIIEKFLKKI